MKNLIELNVNLDRVAEALERQAAAQERLVELLRGWLVAEQPEIPERPADLEALGYVRRVMTENEEREMITQDLWKYYVPAGGRRVE